MENLPTVWQNQTMCEFLLPREVKIKVFGKLSFRQKLSTNTQHQLNEQHCLELNYAKIRLDNLKFKILSLKGLQIQIFIFIER